MSPTEALTAVIAAAEGIDAHLQAHGCWADKDHSWKDFAEQLKSVSWGGIQNPGTKLSSSDILRLHATGTVGLCTRVLHFIFTQMCRPPAPLPSRKPDQGEGTLQDPYDLALHNWLCEMERLLGAAGCLIVLLKSCSMAAALSSCDGDMGPGPGTGRISVASAALQLQAQLGTARTLQVLAGAIARAATVDAAAAKALVWAEATKAAAGAGGAPLCVCSGGLASLRYDCCQVTALTTLTLGLVQKGLMSAAGAASTDQFVCALQHSALVEQIAGALLATDCSGLRHTGCGEPNNATRCLEGASMVLCEVLCALSVAAIHPGVSLALQQAVRHIITRRFTFCFAYSLLLRFAEVTNSDLYGESPVKAPGTMSVDGVPLPPTHHVDRCKPAPPHVTSMGTDGSPLPPRGTELWPLLALFDCAPKYATHEAADGSVVSCRVVCMAAHMAVAMLTQPLPLEWSGQKAPAADVVAAGLRLVARGMWRLAGIEPFCTRGLANVELIYRLGTVSQIARALTEYIGQSAVQERKQEEAVAAAAMVDCLEAVLWCVTAAVRAICASNADGTPSAALEGLALIMATALVPQLQDYGWGWTALHAPVRQAAARRLARDVAPLRAMDSAMRLAVRSSEPEHMLAIVQAVGHSCRLGFPGEMLSGLPPDCPQVVEWDMGLFTTVVKLTQRTARQLRAHAKEHAVPASQRSAGAAGRSRAGDSGSSARQVPSLAAAPEQLIQMADSCSGLLLALWRTVCGGALASRVCAAPAVVPLLATSVMAAAALARAGMPAARAGLAAAQKKAAAGGQSDIGFLSAAGVIGTCCRVLALAASATAQHPHPHPQLAAALQEARLLQVMTMLLAAGDWAFQSYLACMAARVLVALAALPDCSEGAHARQWLRRSDAQQPKPHLQRSRHRLSAAARAAAAEAEQSVEGMPAPGFALEALAGAIGHMKATGPSEVRVSDIGELETLCRLLRSLSLAAPAARGDEELRLAVVRALGSRHGGHLALAAAACPWAMAGAAAAGQVQVPCGAGSEACQPPEGLPPLAGWWCGNPGCGNFEGAAEAELTLHRCAGCCGVRYCSVDCQREHWAAGHCAQCVLASR